MYVEMSKDPDGVVGQPGKIALSGASGMLGATLRRRLATREARVMQLVRGKPEGAGQLTWNPSKPTAVADPSALEGYDAAVHLSGASVAAHRWTAEYRRELKASRVESTRALATILAGLHNPPRTLIVASAVGIYGDRGEEVLDEASAPGKGFLADLCQQWEEAATPAAEAGIRVVHTRFGVVLGRGLGAREQGALEKMLPVFRAGLGGRLGSGRQWMSWINLDDAIAAVLFALETRSLAGPVNVVAPNAVTNAEFTRALARQVRRPAVLPAPAFALRLALGPMADEALLASARVVPAKLTAAGFRFTHATLEEALAAALG
ncbi:MAG: TIGR01777 family oxidoreductase [Terracidiphilus sp.]